METKAEIIYPLEYMGQFAMRICDGISDEIAVLEQSFSVISLTEHLVLF